MYKISYIIININNILFNLNNKVGNNDNITKVLYINSFILLNHHIIIVESIVSDFKSEELVNLLRIFHC
jgi:hypothetical protein